MAKDPAFLFYSGDFSTGTQFFTDEQIGKYLRLLMAQHQHGRLSEKHMMHICKTYDEDIMKKFKKDDAGMYFNERLENEILRRKTYSESRRNNRKSNTDKPHKTKNISFSYVKHMENENEIKDEYKIVLKRWCDFKKARSENYKNADSFMTMYRKLLKLSSGNVNTASEIIEDAIGNNYAGFFKLKNNNGHNNTPTIGRGTVEGAKNLLDSAAKLPTAEEIRNNKGILYG